VFLDRSPPTDEKRDGEDADQDEDNDDADSDDGRANARRRGFIRTQCRYLKRNYRLHSFQIICVKVMGIMYCPRAEDQAGVRASALR
jgi:hypothetical protein